jgi:hypothetical protein
VQNNFPGRVLVAKRRPPHASYPTVPYLLALELVSSSRGMTQLGGTKPRSDTEDTMAPFMNQIEVSPLSFPQNVTHPVSIVGRRARKQQAAPDGWVKLWKPISIWEKPSTASTWRMSSSFIQ